MPNSAIEDSDTTCIFPEDDVAYVAKSGYSIYPEVKNISSKKENKKKEQHPKGQRYPSLHI
jgi:hypothetical protein